MISDINVLFFLKESQLKLCDYSTRADMNMVMQTAVFDPSATSHIYGFFLFRLLLRCIAGRAADRKKLIHGCAAVLSCQRRIII